jgi:hypothetical protein
MGVRGGQGAVLAMQGVRRGQADRQRRGGETCSSRVDRGGVCAAGNSTAEVEVARDGTAG